MKTKFFVVLAVFVLALVMAFPAMAAPDRTNERQIEICHATSSETNPYVSQHPAIQNNGDLTGGHHNHENDIIPPYSWDGGSFPGQGDQSILENGCNDGEDPEDPGDPGDQPTPRTIPVGANFTFRYNTELAGSAATVAGKMCLREVGGTPGEFPCFRFEVGQTDSGELTGFAALNEYKPSTWVLVYFLPDGSDTWVQLPIVNGVDCVINDTPDTCGWVDMNGAHAIEVTFEGVVFP